MKIDWIIIKRIIENSASPQEQSEFDAWLNNNDDNRSYFKEIKSYYKSPLYAESLNSQSRHKEVDGKSIINNYRRRKIRRVLLSVSTSTAALVVFSFLFFNHYMSKVENENRVTTDYVSEEITVPILITPDSVIEIISDNSKIIAAEYSDKEKQQSQELKNSLYRLVIPSGRTYTLLLPDSTEVMLNANSELSYSSNFNDMSTREVILKGEAFFDVVKSDKPFVVSTDDMSVKVYGTKFNVNTNKCNVCETILISGSVGVTTEEYPEVIMNPNQLFSFDKIERRYTVKEVDPSIYVTWMSDYLSCQNEPLYILLDKLSTWYGVDFSLNKDVSKDMNVTISLSKQLPIEEFLNIVEYSLNITFEKVSNKTFNVLNNKKKEGR